MKIAIEQIIDICEARRLLAAETLEKARLRDPERPCRLTGHDQVRTLEAIYDITSDFDPDTRSRLLTSAIVNAIAGIRPISERDAACARVLRIFKEQTEASSRKPNKRNRRSRRKRITRAPGSIPNFSVFDPEDPVLADATLERTFRRRAGAKIGVTQADLNGTVCLIHQLMCGLDYKLLIDVLCNCVADSHDGEGCEHIFAEFEGILRKTIVASDFGTELIGDIAS